MCTIMTLTKKQARDKAIQAMIRQDFMGNPHGTVLLLDNKLMLTSLTIEPIISMINTVSFDRCWIHQRYASTMTMGLSGCHNFYSKDRHKVVMHNGVISNHNELPVDSQRIVDILDAIGDIEQTAQVIIDTEYFANFFIIDLDKGTYTVARCTSGTLHTDGKGNYSSHAVGEITIPVAVNSFDTFDYLPKRMIRKFSRFNMEYLHNSTGYSDTDTGLNSWNEYDDLDNYWNKGKHKGLTLAKQCDNYCNKAKVIMK